MNGIEGIVSVEKNCTTVNKSHRKAGLGQIGTKQNHIWTADIFKELELVFCRKLSESSTEYRVSFFLLLLLFWINIWSLTFRLHVNLIYDLSNVSIWSLTF